MGGTPATAKLPQGLWRSSLRDSGSSNGRDRGEQALGGTCPCRARLQPLSPAQARRRTHRWVAGTRLGPRTTRGKAAMPGPWLRSRLPPDGCALRRRFRKFGHCRFVFVKSVMMISPAQRKVPGKRRVGLAGGFSPKQGLASSLDLNLN